MTRHSSFPQLDKSLVSKNSYWRYYKDRYALPSGEERDYHYMQTNGSVLVVPVQGDGSVVLVRQFRYLQQQWGLEFPGGGQKPSLSSLDNAKEELHEEVGMHAGCWEQLGTFSPCVGLIDETCDVYLAQDLTPGEASPEESEVIEIVAMAEEDVDAAILEGSMWSGMSLAVWMLYKLWKARAG
ncbi:MAG: NUDIX hydrolase [Deltaproteobacteria bacterium]|nr:MAG: NUDIX hydrolase [Deltaproteobacteria bacterium]